MVLHRFESFKNSDSVFSSASTITFSKSTEFSVLNLKGYKMAGFALPDTAT